MEKFSNRLKELRFRKLTQIDVANAVGVSFGIISKWENSKRQPTLENTKALCLFFNISSDYLLGLED